MTDTRPVPDLVDAGDSQEPVTASGPSRRTVLTGAGVGVGVTLAGSLSRAGSFGDPSGCRLLAAAPLRVCGHATGPRGSENTGTRTHGSRSPGSHERKSVRRTVACMRRRNASRSLSSSNGASANPSRWARGFQ